MRSFATMVFSILLTTGVCLAAPNPRWEQGVPTALREWIPWVRDELPELDCPTVGKDRQCAWPGTISFQLKENGASFSALAVMFSEGMVSLPSSLDLPLHSLKVTTEEGSPVEAVVVSGPGGLQVKLPKGRFKLSGELSWISQPGSIPVPGDFGVLSAISEKDTKPVALIRDDHSFRVVRTDKNLDNDALTLTVFRRISDGNPVELETLINFRVSGGSRSLQLGKVLPDGAVPVGISTSLPHQLKQDGTLAVQLVPGEYSASIRAILQQPVRTLSLPQPPTPFWPNEETIVFQSDSSFRSVEVKGLAPLSAELSQIPSSWSGSASYVGKAGATFTLQELSRGEQSRAPDSVTLNRDLWIDLDGQGFTVRDRFSGQLSSAERLNALDETKLGRASVNSSPILIATDPSSKASGIELRNTQLNVDAVSRVEKGRVISAVGWYRVVDRLNLSLSLPPSWKLIAVRGARSASGSWIDSWTLLDVFLSMLIAVGAYHMFGRVAAVLVAISLIINHEEFLAPRILLVHLMLLVVWRSMIQKTDSGWHKLSSLLALVTFAAIVLQSSAFIKLQVTQFLYPQLQAGTRYRTFLQELIDVLESSFVVWPYILFVLGFAFVAVRSSFRGKRWYGKMGRLIGWGAAFFAFVIVSGIITAGGAAFIGGSAKYQYAGSNAYQDRIEAESPTAAKEGRYAESVSRRRQLPMTALRKTDETSSSNQQFSYEDKVFLAGPALPQWRWRTHTISVDGPVGPSLNLRFIFLPPLVTRSLSLVRIVALALLLAVLFRRLGYSLPKRKTIISTAAVCLAVSLGYVQSAQADIPSPELLESLKRRMVRDECVRDLCTTILDSTLRLTPDTFQFSLTVSSEGSSSITVPGSLSIFLPVSVTVNGKVTTALRRSADNYLQVQVEGGNSIVEVKGNLAERSAFSLQFPQRLNHMNVDSQDWFVEGLSSNGTPSESVRFTNRSNASAQADETLLREAQKLPIWITASRSIFIGDQITVSTTLERLGAVSQAASVEVPLLPGENVTTPGFRSDGKTVSSTFQAGDSSITYSSTIPYTSALSIEAKGADLFTENWRLSCAPIVNCSVSGLVPTWTALNGSREYQWQPFTGEKVAVSVKPLSGISGDLMTIDSVKHGLRWGTNILDGTITVSARATQQHALGITLPSGAILKSALVDGSPGSITSVGENVSALLNPGNHSVVLTYSLAWSPSFRESTPEIKFTIPVHNVTIEVVPSEGRWLLWTGGVPWGPAVIFWSKLFFVTLICLAAAWFGLLPLSIAGAVLLAVGLTTLPVVALVIPLAWLVALRLLPEMHAKIPYCPAWLKVTLFSLLTLIALAFFYRIVQTGLVLAPPMLIAGNQSYASSLKWFVDHAQTSIPRPWVISLSIEWWRVFALAWSTWLVVATIRWIRRSAETIRILLAS